MQDCSLLLYSGKTCSIQHKQDMSTRQRNWFTSLAKIEYNTVKEMPFIICGIPNQALGFLGNNSLDPYPQGLDTIKRQWCLQICLNHLFYSLLVALFQVKKPRIALAPLVPCHQRSQERVLLHVRHRVLIALDGVRRRVQLRPVNLGAVSKSAYL